jgi:hypothetical protein
MTPTVDSVLVRQASGAPHHVDLIDRSWQARQTVVDAALKEDK